MNHGEVEKDTVKLKDYYFTCQRYICPWYIKACAGCVGNRASSLCTPINRDPWPLPFSFFNTFAWHSEWNEEKHYDYRAKRGYNSVLKIVSWWYHLHFGLRKYARAWNSGFFCASSCWCCTVEQYGIVRIFPAYFVYNTCITSYNARPASGAIKHKRQ